MKVKDPTPPRHRNHLEGDHRSGIIAAQASRRAKPPVHAPKIENEAKTDDDAETDKEAGTANIDNEAKTDNEAKIDNEAATAKIENEEGTEIAKGLKIAPPPGPDHRWIRKCDHQCSIIDDRSCFV